MFGPPGTESQLSYEQIDIALGSLVQESKKPTLAKRSATILIAITKLKVSIILHRKDLLTYIAVLFFLPCLNMIHCLHYSAKIHSLKRCTYLQQ